ncbi:hypothetical protein ANAPC1_00118 [Anaplasma phagocytophilum]|uniref:Uncharacterized protein n=1 Tax=Anaplasma phagocytophilum TaxID=948 RepID=A0AA45ZH07_ANAPH|nr:hypothetical protein ANAPC1_00118 [Anaplasma phagocytophilum]
MTAVLIFAILYSGCSSTKSVRFLAFVESGIAAFIPLYQDLTLSLSQHVILEILLKAKHSQLATR